MKKNIRYVFIVLVLTILLLLRGDSKEPIQFTTDDGFLVQHAGEK